jgi:hypothetical protein
MNIVDMDMAGTLAGVGQASPSHTLDSEIFTGPPSVQDKENQSPCHSPIWLHRNNNYVRVRHQVFGDNASQQSSQIVQDPGVCHLVKFIHIVKDLDVCAFY